MDTVHVSSSSEPTSEHQACGPNLSVDFIFSNLSLPLEVRKAYQSRGVKNLYPWQQECLYSTNVLQGENLVYCAPTSGGKTLVAELVIFKTILTLKKQALFVLPYVSLVVEKERYFKSMVKIFNRTQPAGQRLSVRGFFGDQVQQSRSYRESILICTIEKANGILNSLIQRGKSDQLGCVVLDEMHVLGNKFNGFLLEILISKLQYCSAQANLLSPETSHTSSGVAPVQSSSRFKAPPQLVDKRATSFRTIQVIAMSATMGNVQSIADWLRGQLYVTHFRPVPLTEYVKAGNLIMNKQGETIRTLHTNHIVDDPDHIVTMTLEALSKRQQILIFCSSKLLCSQTCVIIAKSLSKDPPTLSDKVKAQRQDLLFNLQEQNGMMFGANQDMVQCIHLGIAYHHAGLTSTERHTIESAYKSGIIIILCATSTLAAGVNLPAGCVLIRSLNIGRETLDVVQYRQMSGRAGRAGQSTTGESFLLVKAIENQKALHIANSVMPDVTSQLHPSKDGGNGLLKAAIELIGLGLVTTVSEYVLFIQQTLLYAESSIKTEAMDTAMLSLKFLIEARIVDCSCSQPLLDTATIKVSRFGSAMMKSSLHPDEAIVIYESLTRAMDGLNSDCILHLLYLVTPLDHAVVPDFKRLLGMYEHSIKHCSDNGKSSLGSNKYPVIANVFESVGIDLGVLHKWQFKAPSMSEIAMCNQAVKLYSLFTNNSSGSNDENGKVAKPSLLSFKSGGISKYDWKVLSYCKRISAALILQSLIEGRVPALVAKETGLQPADIDALLRNSRVMTAKVIKFCTEMGWSFLSKMITSFQSQIDGEISKEMKSLLSIPMMTRKIANVLILNNIVTVEQFVKCSVGTLAKYLQLSIGFELQDLQAIEVELDVADNLLLTESSTPLTSPLTVANGNQQHQGYGTKQTRDEHTQITLLSLITKLMSNANELLSKVTEVQEDTTNSYLNTLNFVEESLKTDLQSPTMKSKQQNHDRPRTASSTSKSVRSGSSRAVFSSDEEDLSSSDEEQTRSEVEGSDQEEGSSVIDPEAEETERLQLLTGLNYVMKSDVLSRTRKQRADSTASVNQYNVKTTNGSTVKSTVEHANIPLNKTTLALASSGAVATTTIVGDLMVVSTKSVDDFYSYGTESPVILPTLIEKQNLPSMAQSPILQRQGAMLQHSPAPSIQSNLPPIRRGSPSVFSELLTRNSQSPSGKLGSQSSSSSSSHGLQVGSGVVESAPMMVNEITIKTSTPTKDGTMDTTTTTMTLTDEQLMEMMEELENNGLLIAGDDNNANTNGSSSNSRSHSQKPSTTQVKPQFVKASDFNNFVYYPRDDIPTAGSESTTTIPTPNAKFSVPYETPHLKSLHRDRTSGFGLTPISPMNRDFMYTCATRSNPKHALKTTTSSNSSSCDSSSRPPSNLSNRNLLYHSGTSRVQFSVTKKVSPTSQFNNNNNNTSVSNYGSTQVVSSPFLGTEDVLSLGKRNRLTAEVQSNESMTTPALSLKRSRLSLSTDAKLLHNTLTLRPSPMQASSVAKNDSLVSTNNGHTALMTARKSKGSVTFDGKLAISPFQTPFTSSKVKTPGKYLYYPLFDTSGSIVDATANNNNTTVSSIASAITSANNVGTGFGMRFVTNPQHCLSFIDRLTHCSCVSFELVFKELPSSVLTKHMLYNSNSRHNPAAGDHKDAHSYTWWPLISSAFNKHTSVSKSTDDNPSLDAFVRMSKEPPAKGDRPHVLVGIALCFGLQDEFSYYVPLPAPLPLIVEKTQAVNTTALYRPTVSLHTLPLNCHKLICKYVGFHNVLHKCPLLKAYMASAPSTRESECVQSSVALEEWSSNPLLLVNSHWCHVARSTLLEEWRKGGCIEWQVVNELMSNSSITKVAVDIQNKLVVLRERDVLVNGPLSDPLIAKQLIDHCTEDDTLIDIEIPIVDTHSAISQEDSPKMKENSMKIACFLAISVLRVMGRYEGLLSRNRLLDLYQNIEMPLLYSVSDAEFCGILIDSPFFNNLRQIVKDRLSVIEYYFNCIRCESTENTNSGHINLESYIDVNIWKERLISGCIARVKETLEDTTMDVTDANTRAEGFSDKDAWKQLILSSGLSIEELVSQIVETRHPLIQLISEHRSLTKLIPVCSGTLKFRSFNRVKALYSTLGTATGRIMLSNPPLQMVPHLCDFIPAPRMSLHEELSLCEADARQSLINEFNIAVIASEAVEWVRVKSLTPHNEVGELHSEYSNGKLHKILNRSIKESFYVNYSPSGITTTVGIAMKAFIDEKHADSGLLSETTLMALWQENGYLYNDNDDNSDNILQVIVEFPHSQGDPNKRSYYTYPADKVFRTQSVSVPPLKELELISVSIQPDWIETQIHVHCNPLHYENPHTALLDEVQSLYDCIQVRDGFIAAEGFVFIGADYCQIELRILAHYCKDDNLRLAICESPDVFKSIAARWRHKNFEDVETEERNTVKQMCYALIYGAGPSLVAEHAHITVEAAQSMMEDFLKIFPGISLFIASVKKKCRRVGYVETLFGRRRVLNDVKSNKKAQRGRADRQAVNMLCQGTAADLIKLAMINIHSRLKELSIQSVQQKEQYRSDDVTYFESSLDPLFLFRRSRHLPGGGLYKTYDDVRPVLQIHDELLFEVRVSHVHKVAKIVKECMENAVVLSVPLEVKLSVGSNWGCLEPYSPTSSGIKLSKALPLVRDLFGKDDE